MSTNKATTSNDAISLTGVTKMFRTTPFKRKTAVRDLTFSVAQGEVVGLLGANGSGKSTTIKMIMGFLKPTFGEILVCGHSAEEKIARSFIGYLPENPRFQKFLRADQVMHYFASLLGMSRAGAESKSRELLELVGLTYAARERIQVFSKGMTQRLAVAQSLLNDPKILIFDEPMSGLDPLGRMEIRQLIGRIHSDLPHTTIFFSTHILGDVEQLCSSVILLKNGALTRHCQLSELLVGNLLRYELQAKDLSPELEEKFLTLPGARRTASGLLVNLDDTSELLDYLGRIQKTGAKVVSLTTHRKNLEEALFSDRITQIAHGNTKRVEESK
jgi:ABC-2 type transport system ATP-binding protein